MALEKNGTKLVSTSIKVEGYQGICTIKGLLPGAYKLAWQPMRLNVKITIPGRAVGEVSFEFRFIKGGGGQLKEVAPQKADG
jgi:hypothetical protein